MGPQGVRITPDQKSQIDILRKETGVVKFFEALAFESPVPVRQLTSQFEHRHLASNAFSPTPKPESEIKTSIWNRITHLYIDSIPLAHC